MQEQYTVSARKFRPDSFNKVVGQQHVTNTLKNALQNNCLAQAFLFCGPRGVGKTTCARILAKAINCEKLTPKGEPCNNCAACQRSTVKESGGIFELDAASNNSVDDIRMLVDQVRYLPQADKYKVYIIDEVHMLSNAAFNAFLKTLEEPPKHAIFILATTEKHKIIPTILSRCQVFDFRRVKTTEIVAHLEYVAQMRKIKYEIEALYVLAEKADGAMRDALSLLDMVASFDPNSTIQYKNVIENLHIIDYEYYFQIVDSCWERDIKNCLIQFTNILEKGFDGQNFTSGLCTHLRNLLVIKYDNSPEILIDVSEKIKQLYINQADKVSIDFLLQTLEIITKYDFQYKNSYNKRLLIELMLISINTATEKKNFLQINDLEKPNSEKKKTEAEKKNPPPPPQPQPQKTLYIDKEPEKLLVLEKTNNQEERITKQGPLKNITLKQKLNTTIKIPKLDALIEPDKSKQENLLESQKPISEIKEGTKEKINRSTTLKNIEESLTRHAQNFLTEGKATEHSILTSKKKLEDNALTFFLSNPIQKIVFKDLKPLITAILKDEFDADFLQVSDDIEIDKKTIEKKPYTNNEKLNHLIKKYPLVQDLINKLSLLPI